MKKTIKKFKTLDGKSEFTEEDIKDILMDIDNDVKFEYVYKFLKSCLKEVFKSNVKASPATLMMMLNICLKNDVAYDNAFAWPAMRLLKSCIKEYKWNPAWKK